MRADHEAPSSSGPNLEHGFLSSRRTSVPDLRALVDDVLRAAVAAARDGSPHATSATHGDAMRELCATARAKDVRAETLILAIKDGWRRLPQSNGGSRLDTEATLAAVITGCIREYYAPRPA